MKYEQPPTPIRVGYSNSAKNVYYSILIFGAGAIFGGVVSVFLFLNITGGSAEPSQPISAPQLSLEPDANLSQAAEPGNEANSSELVETESNELIIPPEINVEPNEANTVLESEADNEPAENARMAGGEDSADGDGDDR